MKKGISLIELIIYIGIVAIVLVAMTDLATRLVFAQVKTAKSSEVTQNLNLVMEKLTSDIENAKDVNTTLTQLTLTMVDNSQIIYLASGGKITEQKGVLAPVDITNNMVAVTIVPGALIFEKISNSTGNNSVKINLTLASVADNNDQQTAQLSVLARSK